MKKIEAFIRHEAFEPIRTELLERGFPSLSIGEVKGSGRQRGRLTATAGEALGEVMERGVAGVEVALRGTVYV